MKRESIMQYNNETKTTWQQNVKCKELVIPKHHPQIKMLATNDSFDTLP